MNSLAFTTYSDFVWIKSPHTHKYNSTQCYSHECRTLLHSACSSKEKKEKAFSLQLYFPTNALQLIKVALCQVAVPIHLYLKTLSVVRYLRDFFCKRQINCKWKEFFMLQFSRKQSSYNPGSST